jgi:hypothetical protein
MGHAGPLHTPCKKVVIGSAIKKIIALFSITEKPRFNESEGTNDFVFHSRDFLLWQGLFTIRLIYFTEGLKIKFFIA